MQLFNQTCLVKEVHLQPIGTKVGMIQIGNNLILGLQGRKIMRRISPPKTQDVHKLRRIIGLAKTTGTIDQIPTTMDKDLATIALTIDHIRLTIETIDLLLLIGTIDNIPRVGITKGTIRLQPITIGLLLRDGIIKIHPKGRIHHT